MSVTAFKPTRISVIACFALVGIARSQTPPPTVEQWIRELGASNWQQRQQAEDALVEVGEVATEKIKAALSSETNDFEIRERLESALSRIASNRQLIGTIVTLDRRFDRPIDAFEALAELASLRVDPATIAAAGRAQQRSPLQVTVSSMSWLEALDVVIASAGIDAHADGDRLILSADPPAVLHPRTHYAGTASIVADSAHRRSSLDLASGVTADMVTMRLRVDLDPRTKLGPAGTKLLINTLTGVSGESLIAEAQAVTLKHHVAGGYRGELWLHDTSRLPRSIATLGGELHAELVVTFDEIHINDFATLPRSIDIAAGHFEVTSLEAREKLWILTIHIPAMTWGEGLMKNNDTGQEMTRKLIESLRVNDQGGKPMRVVTTNVNMSESAAQVAISIAGDDPTATPADIVWISPNQTRDIVIPFTLTNLSLPQ